MNYLKRIIPLIFVAGLVFSSGCAEKKTMVIQNALDQKYTTVTSEDGSALSKGETADGVSGDRSTQGEDARVPVERYGSQENHGQPQEGSESEIVSPAGRPSAQDTLKPAPQVKRFTEPRSDLELRTVPKIPDETGTVTFNFDDADLYEVIRVMGEILNINYIVDPGIRGSVTIHTSGSLKRRDLYSIFHQILELNGLAAVQEGNLVKIIKANDISRMPGIPYPGGGRIIQLVPLRYVDAGEVTKLLAPFTSSDGVIVSDQGSNTLLIVDRAVNMPKLVDLIKVFDVDVFENIQHKFYRLYNIEADEAGKLISQVVSAQGAKDVYGFIPIKRTNTLLVTCKKPRDFVRIDELVEKIDETNDLAEPQIYVYYVRNGQADELSELLGTVFQETTSSKDKKNELLKQTPDTPPSPEAVKKELFPSSGVKKTTQTKGEAVTGEGSGGSLRGEVRITPDTIRNALIINALPSDYRIVKRLLDQVDILPRQVLIEAIIAEITLSDSIKLGVDWEYNSEGGYTDGLVTGTISESGLSLVLGLSDKLKSSAEANETNSDVNILSSPRLLASDNKEAKINIADQIPVATTTYDYTESTTGILETDIQYRDTGIILSVTPHINDRGLVSMEISQEVSDFKENFEVAGSSYPSFTERKVETSLTVQHGQTIVIGGLIREKNDKTQQGVPFLSQIPVIGFLFGQHNTTKDKVELIILITPWVIRNQDDIDEVTREFKTKVGTIITPLQDRPAPAPVQPVKK